MLTLLNLSNGLFRGAPPLSLVGMQLRGRFDFNWAPTNRAILESGQRGVLVRNLSRFTATDRSTPPILSVRTGHQFAKATPQSAHFFRFLRY